MSKKKITVRRICPACNGRGKSYGRRYCGCCRGKHKITETATVEEIGDSDADSLFSDLSDELSSSLEGLL